MSNFPSSEAIAMAAPAARRSRQARVAWGDHVVTVGGDAPVRVQSMTNTDTVDVIGTAIQCKELAQAGSELVRITVNTPEAAEAVPHIREQLDRMGIPVPLVGDFHYNGHRLLTDHPAMAQALSKYRINPGNVGKGDKKDRQFAQMVEVAARLDKVVRIGVNWGSLDQELLVSLMDQNARSATPLDAKQVMYQALVQSALTSADYAAELGLKRDNIIISCKVSGVQDLISVYRALARRCDYALHLGLTEAGMGTKGTVASAAALSVLLQEGIGDTIRVSLTPQPGEARTQVVVAAPPAPPSRNWPSRSMIFCVRRCRSGRPNTRVSRTSRWPSWAASSTARARANTPTSASACLARAKHLPHRCSSTGRSA